MKALKLLISALLFFSFMSIPLYSQPFDDLLLKGLQSAAEGELDEAKDFLNKILKNDPGNENAGKYLSVIKDVTDQKLNEEATASYFNGSIHVLNEQFENAISEFKKTVKLAPDYAMAYMALGDAYVKDDHEAQALFEYEKVKELEPENIMAYLKRADIFLNQQGESLAKDEYNELVKNNPRTAEAYIQRGGFYLNTKRLDKAISDNKRAIELDPLNARCHQSIGHLYSISGQLDLAMSSFDKAIELEPEKASGYIAKGVFYARVKDDCKSAIPELSKAIEMYPAGAAAFEFAEAYNFRGICYSKSGMYDKGISDATKKIELAPEEANGYINRGIHYSMNDQVKEACIDWKYACEKGDCNTYIDSRIFGPCDIVKGEHLNSKNAEDFQLIILSKDFFDLKPGRDKEKAFKVFNKKGNKTKNHLFTVSGKDIESYDWDLQTITLTEKATSALEDILNNQDDLKEEIEDINELNRAAGYQGSNMEFELEKKCFVVKYKNKFVYGGIFLNVVSNLTFNYPVIRVLRGDTKAAFTILPVHIPFNYIDPADESGKIRKERLSFNGMADHFIDKAAEEKVHEIRKLIRDERVKDIFVDEKS